MKGACRSRYCRGTVKQENLCRGHQSWTLTRSMYQEKPSGVWLSMMFRRSGATAMDPILESACLGTVGGLSFIVRERRMPGGVFIEAAKVLVTRPPSQKGDVLEGSDSYDIFQF